MTTTRLLSKEAIKASIKKAKAKKLQYEANKKAANAYTKHTKQQVSDVPVYYKEETQSNLPKVVEAKENPQAIRDSSNKLFSTKVQKRSILNSKQNSIFKELSSNQNVLDYLKKELNLPESQIKDDIINRKPNVTKALARSNSLDKYPFRVIEDSEKTKYMFKEGLPAESTPGIGKLSASKKLTEQAIKGSEEAGHSRLQAIENVKKWIPEDNVNKNDILIQLDKAPDEGFDIGKFIANNKFYSMLMIPFGIDEAEANPFVSTAAKVLRDIPKGIKTKNLGELLKKEGVKPSEISENKILELAETLSKDGELSFDDLEKLASRLDEPRFKTDSRKGFATYYGAKPPGVNKDTYYSKSFSSPKVQKLGLQLSRRGQKGSHFIVHGDVINSTGKGELDTNRIWDIEVEKSKVKETTRTEIPLDLKHNDDLILKFRNKYPKKSVALKKLRADFFAKHMTNEVYFDLLPKLKVGKGNLMSKLQKSDFFKDEFFKGAKRDITFLDLEKGLPKKLQKQVLEAYRVTDRKLLDLEQKGKIVFSKPKDEFVNKINSLNKEVPKSPKLDFDAFKEGISEALVNSNSKGLKYVDLVIDPNKAYGKTLNRSEATQKLYDTKYLTTVKKLAKDNNLKSTYTKGVFRFILPTAGALALPTYSMPVPGASAVTKSVGAAALKKIATNNKKLDVSKLNHLLKKNNVKDTEISENRVLDIANKLVDKDGNISRADLLKLSEFVEAPKYEKTVGKQYFKWDKYRPPETSEDDYFTNSYTSSKVNNYHLRPPHFGGKKDLMFWVRGRETKNSNEIFEIESDLITSIFQNKNQGFDFSNNRTPSFPSKKIEGFTEKTYTNFTGKITDKEYINIIDEVQGLADLSKIKSLRNPKDKAKILETVFKKIDRDVLVSLHNDGKINLFKDDKILETARNLRHIAEPKRHKTMFDDKGNLDHTKLSIDTIANIVDDTIYYSTNEKGALKEFQNLTGSRNYVRYGDFAYSGENTNYSKDEVQSFLDNHLSDFVRKYNPSFFNDKNPKTISEIINENVIKKVNALFDKFPEAQKEFRTSGPNIDKYNKLKDIITSDNSDTSKHIMLKKYLPAILEKYDPKLKNLIPDYSIKYKTSVLNIKIPFNEAAEAITLEIKNTTNAGKPYLDIIIDPNKAYGVDLGRSKDVQKLYDTKYLTTVKKLAKKHKLASTYTNGVFRFILPTAGVLALPTYAKTTEEAERPYTQDMLNQVKDLLSKGMDITKLKASLAQRFDENIANDIILNASRPFIKKQRSLGIDDEDTLNLLKKGSVVPDTATVEMLNSTADSEDLLDEVKEPEVETTIIDYDKSPEEVATQLENISESIGLNTEQKENLDVPSTDEDFEKFKFLENTSFYNNPNREFITPSLKALYFSINALATGDEEAIEKATKIREQNSEWINEQFQGKLKMNEWGEMLFKNPETGEYEPKDRPWYEILGELVEYNQSEIMGMIAGGAAGAKTASRYFGSTPIGKVAAKGIGILSGSMLGAGLGRGMDLTRMAADVNYKVSTKLLLAQMYEAGKMDIILSSLGVTAYQLIKGTAKISARTISKVNQAAKDNSPLALNMLTKLGIPTNKAQNIIDIMKAPHETVGAFTGKYSAFDRMFRGNPRAALKTLKSTENLSDKQLIDIVKNWEQSNGVSMLSYAAKKRGKLTHVKDIRTVIRVLAETTPGFEKRLANALSASKGEGAKLVQRMVERSTEFTNLANTIYNKSSMLKLRNALKDYETFTMDTHTALKQKGAKSLESVSLDFGKYFKKLKLEELFKHTKLKARQKHVIDHLNNSIYYIRSNSNVSDNNINFMTLLEFRKILNETSNLIKNTDILEQKTIAKKLTQVDNIIKDIALKTMSSGKHWHRQWRQSLVEYTKLFKTRETSIFKAFTADNPKSATKLVDDLLNSGLSIDPKELLTVISKVPKPLRIELEGALIDNVMKTSLVEFDNIKIYHLPKIAETLKSLDFTQDKSQHIKRVVTYMAQIQKNDIHIARALGRIPATGSEHFFAASIQTAVRVAISRAILRSLLNKVPYPTGRKLALITQLAKKTMDNPLDSISVRKLSKALRSDKEVDSTLHMLAKQFAKYGQTENYSRVPMYTLETHGEKYGKTKYGVGKLYYTSRLDVSRIYNSLGKPKNIDIKRIEQTPGLIASPQDVKELLGRTPTKADYLDPSLQTDLAERYGSIGLAVDNIVLLFKN